MQAHRASFRIDYLITPVSRRLPDRARPGRSNFSLRALALSRTAAFQFQLLLQGDRRQTEPHPGQAIRIAKALNFAGEIKYFGLLGSSTKARIRTAKTFLRGAAKHAKSRPHHR